MARKSLAELMVSDAAGAVKLTDTYFCGVLDYSEASVTMIERLIDDVHYSMPQGKTLENVDLLCRLWGAYIGEVFRRSVGASGSRARIDTARPSHFSSAGSKCFHTTKFASG